MRYELYPRYAEEPMVIIEARDDAAAEKKAMALAKRGRASGGYLEGGSLCPMRIKGKGKRS